MDNIGKRFVCIKQFKTHLGSASTFEKGCIIKVTSKDESMTGYFYRFEIINAEEDFEYYNPCIRREEMVNFEDSINRVRRIVNEYLNEDR